MAASRTARLMVRMSGTCEPMWKWRSLNEDSIRASRRISIASRISAVARPNLACSPLEVAHLPAPFERRRTRMPIHGSTFISAAILVMARISESFSAMTAAVVVLGDGTGECAIEVLHAVAQQVLEADQQRRVEIERLRLAQGVDDRNGHAVFLQRRDGHVAVGVDVEIPRAPAVDHVE